MADVGIRMSMTENVSSVAPKVSESLRGISRAGEEMNEALQLGDLEKQYKSFADRVDKINDMQKSGEQQLTKRMGAMAPGRAGQQLPATIRRAGLAVQQTGATGDVVEGAGGLLGSITSALGPVGMVIGAFAAAALAANALSRQYEKVLPTIMDVTASFGELKATTKGTSQSFKTTMKEAAGSAQAFGYSLEQGLGALKPFAGAGISRGAALEELGGVMGWARGMGVGPESLSRYQAKGMRFGMGGNLLGTAAGGLQQSGMGLGQFQEFLDATVSIFETGLSRGIVQGFEDINLAQGWMAQLGDAFKGQYGLNLFRKIDDAAVKGTDLQSESDVIMFRAAKRLMLGQEKDTGNYVDIMKTMEAGAKYTPALFGQVRNIVGEMTGGNTNDMVELFREIYGVNYTIAEKLVGMEEISKEELKSLTAPDAESPQLKLLQAQQSLKNVVIDIGEDIAIVKGTAMSGMSKIIEQLQMITGDQSGPGLDVLSRNEVGGFSEVWKVARQSKMGDWGKGLYGKSGKQAANVLRELMADANISGTLEEEGIYEAMTARAREYSTPAEFEKHGTREVISGHDLPEVLRILVDAIEKFNINVEEEKMVVLENYLAEPGGF